MVSQTQATTRSRSHSVDAAIGLGLTLAAFGLYLATLAPSVLEADGGEFQFVPWLPGIAHPTGYPLYILLGWMWTHLLPVGEVAWRMNLLSALLAAATVGLTYTVARQLLNATLPDTPSPARIIAAVVAAASFAVSHTFWSQAIIAEVYALHALFVAALVWLALRYVFSSDGSGIRDTVGISRFAKNDMWSQLLALTFGLGLAHHRTIVLLLPALILFLLTADPSGRRAGLRRPAANIPGGLPAARSELDERGSGRSWLIHAALLVTPLLLYFYLPLIAPFTPYARLSLSDSQTLVLYDNSFQGFWNHIWGTVFSSAIKPTAAGVDRLGLTWQLLRQQVGWVGTILALAGLITLWQRRRVDLLLLTGLGLVAFVVFNLVYFIGDVFVLFIPAWLFVSLWIGLGSLGLASGIARNFVQRKTGHVNANLAFGSIEQRLSHRIYQLLTIILTATFLLLPLVLGVTRQAEINQKNNVAARERWQTILAEPIPQGAVLLSNDRNEIMPLWYYQYVEGRRPDLLGLFPLIVPDPAYANIGRVLEQALASGRPVYLIKPMDGLQIKAELTPAGALFRATAAQNSPSRLVKAVLPEITLRARPGETITETVNLLGYDLTPAKINPGDPITVTLYWQATQTLSIDYSSSVHLISGDQGIAQSDHRPGGDFYPSHLWQIGETVRDQHILTLPAQVPTGEYQLRVGMYYQPEAGVIESMGNGVEIGSVIVE